MLVTGATNGIGLETARELARLGASVYVGGRNPVKTAQVVQEIGGAGSFLADMADLNAVRDAARKFTQEVGRLDVLVNNAGRQHQDRQENSDGIELTWAVNHLAPFLLTSELLPLLRAGELRRAVNVSSVAHQHGILRLKDPEFRRFFSGYGAYAHSKLANILFTQELARREAWLQVNALHPGVVKTGMMDGSYGIFKNIQEFVNARAITAAQGARTSLFLTLNDVGVSGRYFVKEKEAPVAFQARSPKLGGMLWELSEDYLAGKRPY